MSIAYGQIRILQKRRLMGRPVLWLVFVTLGGLAVAQEEQHSAQKGSPSDKQPEAVNRQKVASGDKKAAKPEVTAEERATAMKFASQNHPELARLLEQLEKSRPGEFSRAARELTQQIQTLERIREKNPAKYQTQLENWKRDSQIRVLMARWSRNKDPELEKQVRKLLIQRRESRLVQLRAEQQRMAEQLRKVEEELTAISLPMESQIDREWDQLSKKAAVRKTGEKKSTDLPSSAADDSQKNQDPDPDPPASPGGNS